MPVKENMFPIHQSDLAGYRYVYDLDTTTLAGSWSRTNHVFSDTLMKMFLKPRLRTQIALHQVNKLSSILVC